MQYFFWGVISSGDYCSFRVGVCDVKDSRCRGRGNEMLIDIMLVVALYGLMFSGFIYDFIKSKRGLR